MGLFLGGLIFWGGGGGLLFERVLLAYIYLEGDFASENAAPERMWVQDGGSKLPVVHHYSDHCSQR